MIGVSPVFPFLQSGSTTLLNAAVASGTSAALPVRHRKLLTLRASGFVAGYAYLRGYQSDAYEDMPMVDSRGWPVRRITRNGLYYAAVHGLLDVVVRGEPSGDALTVKAGLSAAGELPRAMSHVTDYIGPVALAASEALVLPGYYNLEAASLFGISARGQTATVNGFKVEVLPRMEPDGNDGSYGSVTVYQEVLATQHYGQSEELVPRTPWMQIKVTNLNADAGLNVELWLWRKR